MPVNYRRLLLYTLCSAGLSLNSSLLFGFASVTTAEQRLNFSYGAELGFIYFDIIDIGSFSQTIAQQDGAREGSSYRTLGLRRSILDLKWSHLDISEMSLRLRPDAQLNSRPGVSRKVDTRAGRSYRPSPTIQLLDSYNIVLTPGKDFRLGWGVFEDIESQKGAYDSSLEFGLEARLPQKFAAYFISWTLRPIDVPRLTPAIEDTYRFTFWLYEGREDRREVLSFHSQSADTGPAGQDPYLGGALSFEAFPSSQWRYSLTGGYGDSKVENGRVSEVFASISFDWQTHIAHRWTRFHWRSQWSRERWHISEPRFAGLQQISHSLTTRHTLASSWYLLLGWQMGTAQHHDSDNQAERQLEFGHKYDFGIEFLQGNFLSYQAMFATELRDRTANGERLGAFAVKEENRRRLNRLGLAVNYRIF